jgi:hypothetical protein
MCYDKSQTYVDAGNKTPPESFVLPSAEEKMANGGRKESFASR